MAEKIGGFCFGRRGDLLWIHSWGQYSDAIHGGSVTSALGINKFHFFSFGPGVGYGYTFVYKEAFFYSGFRDDQPAFRYSTEISTTPEYKVRSFWVQAELYIACRSRL